MSIRIAIDGMGGDRAPEMVVEGVKLAMKHAGVSFVIFGDEIALKSLFPSSTSPSICFVQAPQRIEGGDSGILAVLRRPRSSLALAMKALAAKEVDVVVSAGDSRAVVAMAKHYIGLIGKIKRPVLGVFVPAGIDDEFLLVDAGAYTGSHAVTLVQAALVGQVYWIIMKKTRNPRIGLLNIGKEKFKGPVEVRHAASILQGLSVNFIGFVEPQDIFSRERPVDIVVTNGFVGNIFLKLYEAFSEHLIKTFESIAKSSFGVKFEHYGEWHRLVERYRYEYTGGVPLLGVKKPVIVAHGRSGAFAMCKAIEKAIAIVKDGFVEQMESGIEADPALKNISLLYKKWAVSALGGGGNR